MTFFPKFKFPSNYHYNFPYIVVQPKAGREEQKKELNIKLIKKIIDKSKYKVILIGTSKKFENLNNCINLVNRTSIFDALFLVQNAKYFIGFFGIMTMVALSQKVNCNFVYSNKNEMKRRVYGTPWEKYCKNFLSYRDYIMSQNFVKFLLNLIYNYFFKKIKLVTQSQLFSKILRVKFPLKK